MSSTTPLGTDDLGSSSQRERRRRILDATITLASTGGFDAVQMRAVAEEADVALGTLYRYFPSKIHLLVSALGRELGQAEATWSQRDIPGGTAADRVLHLLHHTSRGLPGDLHLTDALTRAFMFADASVGAEIRTAGMSLTRMLTRAIRADEDAPTDDDVTLARIIGDVWLSSLVSWVTGRATAAETADHLDKSVRLILR